MLGGLAVTGLVGWYLCVATACFLVCKIMPINYEKKLQCIMESMVTARDLNDPTESKERLNALLDEGHKILDQMEDMYPGDKADLEVELDKVYLNTV